MNTTNELTVMSLEATLEEQAKFEVLKMYDPTHMHIERITSPTFLLRLVTLQNEFIFEAHTWQEFLAKLSVLA